MKIINNRIEKFTIKAGIIAIIGINKETIYILLKQKGPSARLTKSF